tara:strand:+ start:152 stop:715 length:564 start_codon:yes stop_codon:yes gene_type:complete
MNNKFTAQELSDFFKQVADGGEIEFREVMGWRPTIFSPSLGSSFMQWRIKPTKKVIDLSILVNSGIDCEFSIHADFHFLLNRKLIEVPKADVNLLDGTAHFGCESSCLWQYCRPRMNHIHAWQGGECPLPEGFRIKVWFRNGDEIHSSDASYLNLRWSNKKLDSDIIAFEVLGLADGYVMPWDQDSE